MRPLVSRLFNSLGLIPLFPVLAGMTYVVLSGGSYFVQGAELLRPVLILAGIQVVVLVILSRFTTLTKAGLVVLFVTLLLTPLAGTVGALALVIFGLLLFFMLGRFGHPLRATRPLAGVLNILTAGLFALVLGSAVSSGHIELISQPNVAANCPPGLRTDGPNIYVFVLDGHARGDILASLYNYDEEPWLKGLEAAGFTVDRGSYTNYAHTEWVLASMFNLLPAQDQPAIATDLAKGYRFYLNSARDALKHGRIDEILHCAGYETIATDEPMSEFSMSSSDRYLSHGEINQFEIHLLQSTRLFGLIDLVAPGWLDAQHRARLEESMTDTATLAATPASRPRFTWVHMLSPHMPPVWSGDEPYPTQATPLDFSYFADNAEERHQTPAEFIAAYRAQLDHLHTRMTETVAAIAAADPTGVIILFSDEGGGAYLHSEDAASSNLPEVYGNLFAARTPGQPDIFAGSPITPLKIFPRLLNAYLNATLAEPPGAEGTWFGPLAAPDGSMQMVPVTPWGSPTPTP